MRPNFVFRPPAVHRSPQLYRPTLYKNRTPVLYDPATEQQVTIGTLSVLSPLYGNVPAVETGDYWIVPLRTTPGSYVITVNTDGTFSYDAGGDTARQQISTKAYDVSASAFFETEEVGDYFTIYVNNSPVTEIAPIPSQSWYTNIPITPVILGDYYTDPEDAEDDIEWSLSLPAGITIEHTTYNEGTPSARAVQQLEGTPEAVGSGFITGQATDPPGDQTSTTSVAYTVGAGIQIPNTYGLAYSTGLELVAALGLDAPSEPLLDASSPLAQGTIISTIPEAGEYVVPGSLVLFTVSGSAETRTYARSFWAARRQRSRTAI